MWVLFVFLAIHVWWLAKIHFDCCSKGFKGDQEALESIVSLVVD